MLNDDEKECVQQMDLTKHYVEFFLALFPIVIENVVVIQTKAQLESNVNTRMLA